MIMLLEIKGWGVLCSENFISEINLLHFVINEEGNDYSLQSMTVLV